MNRIMVAMLLTGSMLSSLWLAWDFRRAVVSGLNIAADEVFEIEKGTSLFQVADQLAARRIVRRPLYFIVLAYWRGESGRLKYGEYLLKPGMGMAELLQLLADGRVRQHGLTIVEGWNCRQLLAALSAHPALDHRLAGKTPDEIMAAIGYPDGSAEGRFFPDTYFFPKGYLDTALLRRAGERMDQFLASEWENRLPDLPYGTAYEALILASIVEKETAINDERARVAGVFVRRLERKMRLQTDPTVIFGMGDAYSGNITRKDLMQDTPYNTYTRLGLPPTPIALPGAASLHAALNPQRGNSLYFVARGDGSHVFSDTLPDHERAVAAFQKMTHE